MAKKPPAKIAASAKARANKKAAPVAAMPARKAARPKPKAKAKLPTLGGGLMGLGGTGAGGMMP